MRIALVTESFYPAVDGTTTTVKAVADRLVDTGHEVQVVAPGPGLGSYRGARVARVRPLDKPGRQVRAALDAFGPDVVHAFGVGRLGAKALDHARAGGVPTVAVQSEPVGDVARWRTRVRADRVLATAPWLADRLDARPWTPGVDTAAFTPTLRDAWLHDRWARSRSGRGPLVVVGYVGGLRKRHGVRRLAELGAVPGIRMVLVGEGAQRAWLDDRLPGARFTGALGTGDLAVALASLDLLVHPGEEETGCQTLREAAASGIPVVAPRAGGAPAVVRHQETGLLYDPADADGLRRAVAMLAADRHRRLLGEHARGLAGSAALPSWTDAVDALITDGADVVPSVRVRSS